WWVAHVDYFYTLFGAHIPQLGYGYKRLVQHALCAQKRGLSLAPRPRQI
ncbi:MAG: hypothetical protein ACI8P2_004907, partial [Candidatus Latescibacterota bacterium]